MTLLGGVVVKYNTKSGMANAFYGFAIFIKRSFIFWCDQLHCMTRMQRANCMCMFHKDLFLFPGVRKVMRTSACGAVPGTAGLVCVNREAGVGWLADGAER